MLRAHRIVVNGTAVSICSAQGSSDGNTTGGQSQLSTNLNKGNLMRVHLVEQQNGLSDGKKQAEKTKKLKKNDKRMIKNLTERVEYCMLPARSRTIINNNNTHHAFRYRT